MGTRRTGGEARSAEGVEVEVGAGRLRRKGVFRNAQSKKFTLSSLRLC